MLMQCNLVCLSIHEYPQVSKVGLFINNTIKQHAMNGHCIIIIMCKRRKNSKN